MFFDLLINRVLYKLSALFLFKYSNCFIFFLNIYKLIKMYIKNKAIKLTTHFDFLLTKLIVFCIKSVLYVFLF